MPALRYFGHTCHTIVYHESVGQKDICIVGIDRYDNTDTDYPVRIYIKPIPIPIILFGFISNRYRYRYICLAPYQTDTDTDNRFKPILTDYLKVLFYILDILDTSIHHTDTDTDYLVWIYIKPIPIYLFGSISNRYRYR